MLPIPRRRTINRAPGAKLKAPLCLVFALDREPNRPKETHGPERRLHVFPRRLTVICNKKPNVIFDQRGLAGLRSSGRRHGVEGPADRPSFHRPIILEFSSSALEQLPDQIAALQVEWDRASAAAKGRGQLLYRPAAPLRRRNEARLRSALHRYA